jgi:hypothetical protein
LEIGTETASSANISSNSNQHNNRPSPHHLIFCFIEQSMQLIQLAAARYSYLEELTQLG